MTLPPQNSSFEDVLQRHGVFIYPTQGVSMLPLLREGRDLAIIGARPRDAAGQILRCKKYDVALYKQGNKYILHRVLKTLPEGYVICGDHNYRREYDVKEEQIIGVLTGFIRDGIETPVTDRRYRLYVHLWCDCFPLRALLLWSKAMLGIVKHKLAARLWGKKKCNI